MNVKGGDVTAESAAQKSGPDKSKHMCFTTAHA